MRFALSVLLLAAFCALADETSHSYVDGEHVILWANKVGPYHNPQETYRYHSLPYCIPQHPPSGRSHAVKWDGLGSVLEGNDLEDSRVPLSFKKNFDHETLCEKTLEADEADQFLEAVKNRYWYQLYIDDLPVWGMVGEVSDDTGKDEDSSAALFTHQSLSISYNQNRIIEINLTTDNRVPITPGAKLSFTFSVSWIPTDKPFETRFSRYLDSNFFEHQIHWFSIFNSFMMVVFLCGLVFLIFMRTLRNDITKYQLEDDDLDLEKIVDESGWKQVHGDVFRAPAYLSFLSALVGTGHQLVVLALFVIIAAIAGSLYVWRGAILTSMITMYTLTSFVSGFSSASFFKKYGGANWKFTLILSAFLFPGAGLFLALTLNWLAIAYSSSAAIPFGTIVGMFSLWLLVSTPLNVVGTYFGRKSTKTNGFPCRITNIPRPILNRKWYSQWPVVALSGGILPFGSIFIEMYFIFTSFWNYKFYYVYGFMLLVFLILFVVTVCVTIVLTYFLLNAEDYRWHWTSFLSGASTGLYVFLYSIFYYSSKTYMTGLFQASYYFGYTLVFCLSLSILCGSVAFSAAHAFVCRIYQNIKGD